MTQNTIPPGYWQAADGTLTPESKVKEVDKERHRVVTEIVQSAEQESARLAQFKALSMKAVSDFIERSLAMYGAALGGQKGNVTLVSYDGRYKITRQIQNSIVFDERLQAAKALIDECIKSWGKGANANLRVIANRAFQVDKAGNINTGRVLELRTYDIQDEKWLQAMQAINDSITVAGTKPYIRFYRRNEETGEYEPISLDLAVL